MKVYCLWKYLSIILPGKFSSKNCKEKWIVLETIQQTADKLNEKIESVFSFFMVCAIYVASRHSLSAGVPINLLYPFIYKMHSLRDYPEQLVIKLYKHYHLLFQHGMSLHNHYQVFGLLHF